MEDHQYYESNAYTYDEEPEKRANVSIQEKDSDALLIELYKERPFLYNKGHNDFKNKIIKDNAWNEISKIMKNCGKFYFAIFQSIFLLHFI